MAHRRSLESKRKILDYISDEDVINRDLKQKFGKQEDELKQNESRKETAEEMLKRYGLWKDSFKDEIDIETEEILSPEDEIEKRIDRINKIADEIKAEQEAKAKAEEEAKIKAEQEAKAKAEEETRIKAEQEAKAKAEEEARIEAEQESKAKAEEEAKIKAEQEAKAKAEEEARIKAEQEAKAKAEEEARIKAEQEAKAKAEEEARIKAEQEAKAKAEEEDRIKAEHKAKAKTTMMEDGLYTFSPEEIAMATARATVHKKETMVKSKDIATIKNAIKNGLTPEEYKKFATAVNQEYEESSSEKYRPEDESIKDEVGDEFSKAEEGNDSRNTQETDLWMNRFDKWYTVLDKVSDKAKFIQMKSDIVRTIRGVIKERVNQRDDNVKDQDTNER